MRPRNSHRSAESRCAVRHVTRDADARFLEVFCWMGKGIAGEVSSGAEPAISTPLPPEERVYEPPSFVELVVLVVGWRVSDV
jgi:hypothetical protein